MDLGLAGKVALVTGASRGLGKSVAETLAAEGAHVVVASRDQEVLEAAAEDIRSSAKSDVLAVPADVTKEKDIRRLVDAATERFEHIDILVANAGGPPASRFETTDVEAWRQGLELNLLSTIHLCRAVVPGMRERRSGRIVAIRDRRERRLPGLYENRPPRRSRRAHEPARRGPEGRRLETMDRPNPDGPPRGARRIRICSCVFLLGAVQLRDGHLPSNRRRSREGCVLATTVIRCCFQLPATCRPLATRGQAGNRYRVAGGWWQIAT